MKNIIKELYEIEVVTFIKITDKVYKIKTEKEEFVLKYIEQNNIDSILEKLKIIKIDFFVYPLKNIYGRYISSFENVNFIILPWIEEHTSMLKDLKLKFFLTSIAELHNKSFYTAKVNEKFFKETYDYIANKIDSISEYIESYMLKIERLEYKSPSQWLFILNYPMYIDSLNKANKHLENFKEKCENKKSVKLAITYNDFDYSHVLLKSQKLVGIENVEITSPIYDIFYTFSCLNEISIDTKMYYEEYFNKYMLDGYEKEWLLSLLHIPKINNLTTDETKNIREVANSFNYIKNSNEISNIIKSQKELE